MPNRASGDRHWPSDVAANIAYDVVPGLTVTAEVDYAHDGKFGDVGDRNWTNADKKNVEAIGLTTVAPSIKAGMQCRSPRGIGHCGG